MADLEEEIFGADSDEEFNNQSASARPTAATTQQESAAFEDDADDLFGDSDDDAKANQKSLGGKLKKAGKLQKKKKSSYSEDNLMDSDEDVEDKKSKRLNQKAAKKRKRSDEKRDHANKKSKSSEDKAKEDGNSGDEYDSGEEVVETQDDRDFIDEDDDQLDLRKEYEDDLQDFDDERPDKVSKKKSKAAPQSSSSSYTPKTKDLDPLSVTLNEIRKPKVKALSDAEKDVMVEKLLRKMAQAAVLDEECFKKKEPALHKVQLLPTVQRAVGMKSLHNTLLEKDFLCYLRDWIEPKSSSSLPALGLRTSVYEMLLKLPCMTEHLKRGNDKVPIGYVIVALRKHKMETPENKRLLKEIMDKWSRPIFSKTDGSSGQILENDEVKTALLRKYSEPQQPSIASTQNNSGKFQSLIAGESNQKKDVDTSRARAPSSYGYLFTVQPELKQLDKRNVMEKSLGEERMKLFKKTVEGGKSSSTGKKENVRAMTISVSGNNLKH